MAKTITFEYDDKEYTLEFTKRSVKEMEKEGFNPQLIDTKPMTLLPELFAGAFKANHRFVKRALIDEIYDALPDKETLIGNLAEMYNEPLEGLMSEPEDEKKVAWKASW